MKLSTFQRLRELNPFQAALYCAAQLTRMTPHYALYFSACEREEDAPLAAHVLSLVWLKLGDDRQKFNLSLQIEKLEAAMPDPMQDTVFGVLPANDAALGLVALLRHLQGDQDDAAVMLAKLAQGGIEAYLLATDCAEQFKQLNAIEDEETFDHAERQLNQTLKAHELMQFEIDWQNGLIDLIESTKASRPKLIKLVQAYAYEAQITTLGIELDGV